MAGVFAPDKACAEPHGPDDVGSGSRGGANPIAHKKKAHFRMSGTMIFGKQGSCIGKRIRVGTLSDV